MLTTDRTVCRHAPRVGPTATFGFEMYLLRINKPSERSFSRLIDTAFYTFQREMWCSFVQKLIFRYI